MYRLNLITHLQREEVPHKSTACIRDLPAMYEAATVADVYDAYQYLLTDDDHLFTCVGTSGPKPLAEPITTAATPVNQVLGHITATFT